jgi:hypothetical protein
MARPQDLNFESNFSATITTAAGELNRAGWIFQSCAQALLANLRPSTGPSVLNLPHLNPLSKESLT